MHKKPHKYVLIQIPSLKIKTYHVLNIVENQNITDLQIQVSSEHNQQKIIDLQTQVSFKHSQQKTETQISYNNSLINKLFMPMESNCHSLD